jgi:hypothetical protein
MTSVRGIACRTALLCLATAVLIPGASLAAVPANGWGWRVTIYGWLPSIDGSTQFPTGQGGPSIKVDASSIIENLKFTAMGTFEARKGMGGLWTDVIYLNVGGNDSGSRKFTVGGHEIPADLKVDASLDIKSWLVTSAGTYLISRTQWNETEVLSGFRVVNMDQTLDWSADGDLGPVGLSGRSGSATVSETIWDGIIGLKGIATLSGNGHWILPYYVDVGTGQSDLTWQAFAAIGYRFTWGATTLGWRYLDYQFDSDSKLEDLSLNGPFIGLSFAW